MSVPYFKVWDPDDHSPESFDEDADATRVPMGIGRWEAIDAEEAAEVFAERRWADGDYLETQTVLVRDPDGVLTRWTVQAEPPVEFHATEKS